MKPTIYLIAFSLVTLATGCATVPASWLRREDPPDLSGCYLYDQNSLVKQGYDTVPFLPNIAPQSKVTVTQQGCEKLTFHYQFLQGEDMREGEKSVDVRLRRKNGHFIQRYPQINAEFYKTVDGDLAYDMKYNNLMCSFVLCFPNITHSKFTRSLILP